MKQDSRSEYHSEYRAYRRLYYFLRIVLFLVFRIKCVGLENIPEGPALLCANHSSNFDPILLSLAVGVRHHVHYMAKIELFRIPVVGAVIHAIGSFKVNRERSDISAVKTAMRYLKSGEKVGIFPEGTRINEDDGGEAKRGAIQIANQLNVPVVPVYIPRNKKAFHTYTIVIGAPYLVNPDRKKLSHDDYAALANTLMDKITALSQQSGAPPLPDGNQPPSGRSKTGASE